MKKIFLIAALFLAVVSPVKSQECEIPIRLVLSEEFTNVPEAGSRFLYNSIERAGAQCGILTDLQTTPIIMTARVDVIDKHVVPGPPAQHVYNLGITLFLANVNSQQKYASHYIQVSGVGKSEQKAYMDAFKRIAPGNSQIQSFIKEGKRKIIQYFDSQYANIIKEASSLAGRQQYDEAITLLLSVPSCSKGYDQCMQKAEDIYVKNRDRLNKIILTYAQTAWASSQNAEGAREAASYLVQIDPESSVYAEGSALLAEMKKQVRSDIDFEMRQKYKDALALEKQRLECIRAIGVAYGNNQKPQTTNLTWLR